MKNRHYYAMSDIFTGDDPYAYNAGFANTKVAIAFKSRKEREEWLRNTKLASAKAITRKEAIRVTKWESGEYFDTSATKCKPVRIYGTGDGYEAQHIVVAESAN